MPLRLWLNDKPDYRAFAAILETREDSQIERRNGVRLAMRNEVWSATVVFPAAKLKAGEYRVKLFGLARGGKQEEIETYEFALKR